MNKKLQKIIEFFAKDPTHWLEVKAKLEGIMQTNTEDNKEYRTLIALIDEYVKAQSQKRHSGTNSYKHRYKYMGKPILTRSYTARALPEKPETPYKEGDTAIYEAHGYRFFLEYRDRPNGFRQPQAFGMKGMAITGCKKINDNDK